MDRGDRAFVEGVSEAYAPAPLSAAERARFDAALESRLERRRRRGGLVPLLVGAAGAAALAWALLPGAGAGPEPGSAVSRSAAQWEYELIYATDPASTAELEDEAMLPDEYAAIASLILDG